MHVSPAAHLRVWRRNAANLRRGGGRSKLYYYNQKYCHILIVLANPAFTTVAGGLESLLMKIRLTSILAFFLLLTLSACVVNEQRPTDRTYSHGVVNEEYVDYVERRARAMGVDVYWVHAPRRPSQAEDESGDN